MAINLRGSGNLMTKLLLATVDQQNRMNQQRQEQQFQTQRDIQTQGFQQGRDTRLDTERERLRVAGRSEADRLSGLEQTQTERLESSEERLATEARGRKETLLRQEGETLSAQKIADDEAGERLMTASGMQAGVDFDPNDIHTLADSKDLITAFKDRQQADIETESPSFGNFVIEKVTQAKNTI